MPNTPKASSVSLATTVLADADSIEDTTIRNVKSSPGPPSAVMHSNILNGSSHRKPSLQSNMKAMNELPLPPPLVPASPSSPKPSKTPLFQRQGKQKQRQAPVKDGRAKTIFSENDLDAANHTPTFRNPYYGESTVNSQGSISQGNLVGSLGTGNGNHSATQLEYMTTPKDESGQLNFDWNPNAPPSRGEGERTQQQRRPSRPMFSHFLSRSRSIRAEDGAPALPRIRPPQLPYSPELQEAALEEPKTAPLDGARGFHDAIAFKRRERSAERPLEHAESRPDHEEVTSPPVKPTSSRGDGKRIMSNIKSTSTQAAAGINRAGRGFWGKLNRPGTSSSGHNKDNIDVSTYVNKVIILPLVEQTRLTRIRGRMEDAKDKTEFWMPALPYRCVDYLNMKGIEHEGLYRQSGSVLDIKKWQARFDRDLDINLLDEEDQSVDVNTIASLLKAWFRALPGEIFPKQIQSQIAQAHPGAKDTPQMLKDELSKLPPFNYYLLFAITCHLALLNSHSDKNKMNYHNLCVCFQPCMGVDAYCFQYLILDWRNCWQGCWTEKEYLIEEYKFMEAQSVRRELQALSLNPQQQHAGMPPPHLLPPHQLHQQTAPYDSASDLAAPPPIGRGSRPGTAQSDSRSSSRQRERPAPSHQESLTNMHSNTSVATDTTKTTIVYAPANPTTPPTISPVSTVSPMRM